MKNISIISITAVVLLLGITGYYFLDEILPLKNKIERLRQENLELRFQIERLQQKNEELKKQLEEKVQQISKEKQAEIEKLKATYDELISGLQEQIQKGEITITRLADQLTVNIVDRVLFPSGEADITPEGYRVLQRVGNILKTVKDKQIKVAGHTDNVPIHPRLQKKFPTNWELSIARATNVVRFLQEKVGIDPRNLEAAGFGPYHPIATNRTRKGRALNRRIEILLLPKPKKVKKISIIGLHKTQ